MTDGAGEPRRSFSRRVADRAALPLDTTVGHLIRRAQQVHTALWHAEFGGDITGPQYAVLSVLTRLSDVDQTTAGELASLDRSNGADVILRLQRHGWLDRDKGTCDARRVVLRLTAASRSALRDITPRAALVQDSLLEPLPASDRLWFTESFAAVAFAGLPPQPAASSAPTARAPALALARTPGHLLRRAEQLHRQHWTARVGTALTPTQYAILSALERELPTDQRTAGELASLDKSSAADIVARLTTRGYVRATADTRDRRRKILTLTPDARTVLQHVTPAVELVQQDLAAPLTAAESHRLVGLLRTVAYQSLGAPPSHAQIA